MCRAWTFVKDNAVIIALLALAVSGISAVFAALSYCVGIENLHIQREASRPTIYFDQETIRDTSQDELLVLLRFRSVTNITHGQLTLFTTDASLASRKLLGYSVITNPMPRGTGGDVLIKFKRKEIGPFLIVCVDLTSENGSQLAQYYHKSPTLSGPLGSTLLEPVGSEDYNKLVNLKLCNQGDPK